MGQSKSLLFGRKGGGDTACNSMTDVEIRALLKEIIYQGGTVGCQKYDRRKYQRLMGKGYVRSVHEYSYSVTDLGREFALKPAD